MQLSNMFIEMGPDNGTCERGRWKEMSVGRRKSVVVLYGATGNNLVQYFLETIDERISNDENWKLSPAFHIPYLHSEVRLQLGAKCSEKATVSVHFAT